MDVVSLRQHEEFGAIEDRINADLDLSLDPRGPDLLYELVAEMALPPRPFIIDVGCGEGRHSIELARRFDADVLGTDPTRRQLEIAANSLCKEALAVPVLAQRVTFQPGSASSIAANNETADLVWCRDVLCLVEDIAAALTEMSRVLKPSGRAIIYQMFSTEALEPSEKSWLLPTMGCVAGNMEPGYFEDALEASGLKVEQRIVLGTEWGEYGQERTGKGAQKLIRCARLLRNPGYFKHEYGAANYAIALGDCLWHIYRLIGKLSDRVYVLSTVR